MELAERIQNILVKYNLSNYVDSCKGIDSFNINFKYSNKYALNHITLYISREISYWSY